MKEYWSIPSVSDDLLGRHCLAFHKYDGSNIRAEWSRKRGWYKFGTRRRLFDHTDPEYGRAIELFHHKYAEPLARLIADCKDFRRPNQAMAFLEFFGPHSFAGRHAPQMLGVESNDPMDLVLFDVNIHKRGLVGPRDFVRVFAGLHIAEVLYDGPLIPEFVTDVREGKFPVREGVVCKGGRSFDHTLWMTKIKTLAYLEELKAVFGTRWKEYWE